MTPYNIANMAKLLGYDMIALTDHNSCLNCESTIKVGEQIGLTVVPGMELCTVEEIHCVCLFSDLSKALSFSDYIRLTMPDIDNNPEIYGDQFIMGTGDEIFSSEKKLLTNASSVSVDELSALIREYGGACFPAHLDRASYSLLSVLGFLYPELNFTAAEFTEKAYLPQYLEKHPLLKEMKIFRNSDAHYLENMPEPMQELDLPECSATALINYINSTQAT